MQFAQGMPHDVALEAGGGKSRGLGRAVHRRDGAQAFAQRIRIVGFDGGDARAGKAEAGEDRLGQRDGLGEAAEIVARLGAIEKRTAEAP